MKQIEFTEFKYPGLRKARWCVQEMKGSKNLIFQFFSPSYDRGYEEALFNASKDIWEKTDVGYTEGVLADRDDDEKLAGAYDIIMTDIKPGTHMFHVRAVLKNLGLEYEPITDTTVKSEESGGSTD